MARRLVIASACALLSSLSLLASVAESDTLSIVRSIEDSGRITINQPAALSRRMQSDAARQSAQSNTDRTANTSTSTQTTAQRGAHGYRVEVFADNNIRTAKKQASARKAKVQARFSQYRTYLVFESPYWRVRVGDFASREAAQAAMAEIRSAMPGIAGDLRVVRSVINR